MVCSRSNALVTSAIVLLSMSCGTPPTQSPQPMPTSTKSDDAPRATDAAPIEKPLNVASDIKTVSLIGDTPANVEGTDLRVFISGSSHKTRAPVVQVSVRVKLGDDQAEVSWGIESGVVDLTWRPIEGRRYDEESKSYKDDVIPGWQVRLDSVDDQSVGGSPTAITVSFRTTP